MSGMFEVAKGLVAFCDVVNTVESLNACKEGNEAYACISLSRLLGLGCNLCEAGVLVGGGRGSALLTIKHIEGFIKLMELQFRMTAEASVFDRTFYGAVRFMERGVVAPFSDLLRVGSELSIYSENQFLEMYKADPNAMRPIYGKKCPEDEDVSIIGYRPIDPKECETKIESCKEAVQTAAKVRVVAEVGPTRILIHVVESAVQRGAVNAMAAIGTDVYYRLAGLLNSFHLSANNGIEQSADGFNLVGMGAIPEALHGDAVFSRYICSITLMPIRDPVGDPNGHNLYERLAILSWLRVHETSPVTRAPLSPSQLLPKEALKTLIDSRLRYHQERLWDYIRVSPDFVNASAAPGNAQLEAAAALENPHI